MIGAGAVLVRVCTCIHHRETPSARVMKRAVVDTSIHHFSQTGYWNIFKENEYKGSYGRARAWEKLRHLFETDL